MIRGLHKSALAANKVGFLVPPYGKVYSDVPEPGSWLEELMAWFMVVGAGLLEMVWSYSAKQASSWSHLGWGAVTIVSSLCSFFLLTFALKTLPLGSAYAAWTGIGAVGSFIVGVVLLGEPLGAWRIVSVLLVVGGVIGLRLTSGE
jgi:quaternary ammonium compound-resistance protein SugE